MTSAPVRHPSAFAPLTVRAFRGIWTANLLSNIGGWMATTGAAWEMTSLTKEPIFVAMLAAAGTLPMFLFCFLAGILADRFDRRTIVCWTYSIQTIVTLSLLGLTIMEDPPVSAFYVMVLLLALARTFEGPANQALLPSVVPREIRAELSSRVGGVSRERGGRAALVPHLEPIGARGSHPRHERSPVCRTFITCR